MLMAEDSTKPAGRRVPLAVVKPAKPVSAMTDKERRALASAMFAVIKQGHQERQV
jgi:hypothetical protein